MTLSGFLSRLKSIGLNQKTKDHSDTPILKQRLSELSTQWYIDGEKEEEEEEKENSSENYHGGGNSFWSLFVNFKRNYTNPALCIESTAKKKPQI